MKEMKNKAAPTAVAVADEREAFADWLVRSYPADYTKAEALRLWHHGDIAALAWEHRAALAATPADHIADAGKMVAAPVRMPEPVAFALEWTFNGEERGMRLYDDETHCRFDAESDGGVCHPLYTEQQVRALLATATAPTEPFGYFKAEPFGWTDCGPDDEGAVALYEKPQAMLATSGQAQADARDAERRWQYILKQADDMKTSRYNTLLFLLGVSSGDEEEEELDTDFRFDFTKRLDAAIAAAKG